MSRVTALLAWLWAVITFVPRRLISRWPWRRSKVFHYQRVEDFPDRLDKAKVYLAGEDQNLWAASMICPCGCGAIIRLNLLQQVRPCWSAQEHSDGTLTLTPSVWRQKGCRSHFVLREGRIRWC